MNPDMVVLAVTLALAALVLWIRMEPTSYSRYMVLGVVSGIGYLSKTFLFVFSPVFIVMAGLCAGSIKKAAPRTLVALLVMLAVSAPLVAALSWRAGRFTYGDTGGTVYALCVSAKGQPTRPLLLNERPKVWLYRWDISCTRPAGFDVCYWTAGLEPDFNLPVQGTMFVRNVWEIFEQVPWLGLLIAAYAICFALGLVRIGGLSPPSVCVLLGVPAVVGLGLFALLRIEARYLAPFIVMATLAMGASLRSVPGKPFSRKVAIGCLGLLTGTLAAILIHTVVDQSYRSLVSTEAKPSYRAIFEETVALGRWLRGSGLKPGDEVGSVGGFVFHAARMAGLKVTAEIFDQERFLEGSRAETMHVVEVLGRTGIKAIVMEARNPGAWVRDGWRHVPGTRQSFVLLFDEAREGQSQRLPGRP
jgi:4-amino-4-deoxy-L-arabinose transferase-like glycosyltransferase